MSETPKSFANRSSPIPTIRFPSTSSTAAATDMEGTSEFDFEQDSRPGTPISAEAKKKSRFSRMAGRMGMSEGGMGAGLQDRLLEKLLQQVIPTDESAAPTTGHTRKEKPEFSLPQMSTNFRRFNSRIGVVFVFQAKLIRLLSWRKPSHTVSLLFVHTFLCLDPYLLAVLPLALLVLGVFIPAFLTRHPAPPIQLSSSFEYSPKGPPLAPAREVKPVKELSKDFFRNMRDLQNCMEDFSVMHDAIVTNVGPVTNFSDEALSSTLFVVCFLGCATMFVGAHVVPWWLIFLLFGWFVILSGHPRIASWLNAEKKKNNIDEREERAKGWLEKWIESDILLDSEPEVQEVEIFELQKLRKETGEWEPWVFSPSPYDPLSSARISDERPKGTRFFEDVAPPKGWEWSEKKWTLDLHSREWVEERIITGVEIETEGERWVYDIHYNEEAARKFGMHDDDKKKKGKSKSKEKNVLAPAKPTWEEGVEGQGKKGLWRRRRWVRLVKRRVMETSEGS